MSEEGQAIPAQPGYRPPRTILIAQQGQVVSELPEGVELVETVASPSVQVVTAY